MHGVRAMVIVFWACGSTAVAQSPCAPVGEPTFRAPNWGLEHDGRPPSAVDAGVRVRRLEASVGALGPNDPATGELLFQLAEAQRDLYRGTHDRTALERSVQALARLIRDAPDHPRMDLVLFRLASLLDEVPQSQRARQVYHRLIRGYPTSPYVGAAYLGFADFYFREDDFAAARAFYERAAAAGSDLQRAYAHYMIAWCFHRHAALLGLPQNGDAAAELDDARARLRALPATRAQPLVQAIARDACTIAP